MLLLFDDWINRGSRCHSEAFGLINRKSDNKSCALIQYKGNITAPVSKEDCYFLTRGVAANFMKRVKVGSSTVVTTLQ
jgi:hypothetical protein